MRRVGQLGTFQVGVLCLNLWQGGLSDAQLREIDPSQMGRLAALAAG